AAIDTLAVQLVALTMAILTAESDPKSYRTSINGLRQPPRIVSVALCSSYAEHINNELKRLSMPELVLDQLKSDPAFITELNQQVSNPNALMKHDRLMNMGTTQGAFAALRGDYSANVVFTVNYLSNDRNALLYSPDQVWDQKIGDFVGHALALQMQSLNLASYTENAIRAWAKAVSINIIKSEGKRFKAPTAMEACQPFQVPLLPKSSWLNVQKLVSRFEESQFSSRGFEDWRSTAQNLINLSYGRKDDWKRAVGAAATKVTGSVTGRDLQAFLDHST
ncbi:MAG: hypothetical protein Q9214_006838, partial [Letrouitia sp. 1 TL-2023]